MKDVKLNWLQKWFFENNNNIHKLEHKIIIETLGNPGWALSVSLINSIYHNNQFKIKIDRTEKDWCYCSIKDNKFEGRGGPFNLNEMLNDFMNFVENNDKSKSSNIIENEIINWMENWYFLQCGDEWEDSERFIIKTTQTGWFFSMFLEDTICEDKFFDSIEVKKTDSDWYKCYRTEHRFEGKGGILNLVDIMNVFINWVEGCENDNIRE